MQKISILFLSYFWNSRNSRKTAENSRKQQKPNSFWQNAPGWFKLTAGFPAAPMGPIQVQPKRAKSYNPILYETTPRTTCPRTSSRTPLHHSEQPPVPMPLWFCWACCWAWHSPKLMAVRKAQPVPLVLWRADFQHLRNHGQ